MVSESKRPTRSRRSRPGLGGELTDVDREILHRAIDSQKITDIAAAVDLTPAEARHQLQRAVDKLLQAVYPVLVVGGRPLRSDREPLGVFLNRPTGERVVRRAISRSARLSMPVSLVEVVWAPTPDGGRASGDPLTPADPFGQKVGQLLFTRLRPEDRCVRWSDHEVIVLLENTDAEKAEVVTRRLTTADDAAGFGIAAVERRVGETFERLLDRLSKRASHALMEDSVRQSLARAHRFS